MLIQVLIADAPATGRLRFLDLRQNKGIVLGIKS